MIHKVECQVGENRLFFLLFFLFSLRFAIIPSSHQVLPGLIVTIHLNR